MCLRVVASLERDTSLTRISVAQIMLYDEENEEYCMYRNGRGQGDVSVFPHFLVHFAA